MKITKLRLVAAILTAGILGATALWVQKQGLTDGDPSCAMNTTIDFAKDKPTHRWSDPQTWGGTLPTEAANIIIPPGKIVLLDVSPPPLSSIEINGGLVFDDQDLTLISGSILLSGGIQIGSPQQAYARRALVRLKTSSEQNQDGVIRGLLLRGGRLEINGLLPGDPRSPANTNESASVSHWGLPRFTNIRFEKVVE